MILIGGNFIAVVADPNLCPRNEITMPRTCDYIGLYRVTFLVFLNIFQLEVVVSYTKETNQAGSQFVVVNFQYDQFSMQLQGDDTKRTDGRTFSQIKLQSLHYCDDKRRTESHKCRR